MKNDLINYLNKEFLYVGRGDFSPLYEEYFFNINDEFWLIPNEKFFVVLNGQELNFYEIVHTNHASKTIIKTYHHNYIDIGYNQITPDQAIELFGKKYKFLIYNLNNIK